MRDLIQIKNASDMDLANIVNETEGFAWRLNHDAADERISRKGVDKSIRELMTTRNKAIKEIKKRTGLRTHEELKAHVQSKLKEQEDMWDNQWAEIYNEGTVFAPKKDDGKTYETIRTYLPIGGCFGPNQYVFFRVRGTTRFGHLDDRQIPQLKRLANIQSMYSNVSPLERGLIKAHEEPAKRKDINGLSRKGENLYKFYERYAVFFHKGFNETFETMEHLNFPNVERCEKNEIILARSHTKPVFVEFTINDLWAMELSKTNSKYKDASPYSNIYDLSSKITLS
jgi:hypothetical protein